MRSSFLDLQPHVPSCKPPKVLFFNRRDGRARPIRSLGVVEGPGSKNNAWMVMGTGTCKNMGMIRGDVHTSSFRSDSKQLTAGAF